MRVKIHDRRKTKTDSGYHRRLVDVAQDIPIEEGDVEQTSLLIDAITVIEEVVKLLKNITSRYYEINWEIYNNCMYVCNHCDILELPCERGT